MFFTYAVSGIEATQKGPSKAWYLLPIFIRIIGGLIMYFALTNRDAKMAKKRLLLSILLLIAEIAISMAIAFFG
jgi:hypothetical protein